MTGSAQFGFTPGEDPAGAPGEPISGISVSEYRSRVGPNAFSPWSSVELDSGTVEAVTPGSAVVVEMRSRDGAGNVLPRRVCPRSKPRPVYTDDTEAIAVSSYAEEFAVSEDVAYEWIAAQSRASRLEDTIANSQWASITQGSGSTTTRGPFISVSLRTQHARLSKRCFPIAGSRSPLSSQFVQVTGTHCSSASTAAENAMSDAVEAGELLVYQMRSSTKSFSRRRFGDPQVRSRRSRRYAKGCPLAAGSVVRRRDAGDGTCCL